MARIHIGTSGWHYGHWVGPFYPDGTKPGELLASYAERFRAVEINSTFYSLPSRDTLAHWRDDSPRDMVFACKASRYVTHMKKLTDPAESTRRFFAAIEALGDKAGPVLFQLPPNWRVDVARLKSFLEAMPSGWRTAFEFRDESWFQREVYDLLAAHDAAFCAYDLDGRRSPVKLTADFAYVRLHGPGGPYQGSYDGRALNGWARRFLPWRQAGKDVFCFLDNDERGYAALNALDLQAMIARR